MKYIEWLNIWLENYIKPNVKQRTYDIYSITINNHIVNKLGNIDLTNLNILLIQTYITELLNSGNVRTGKGLSKNTVNLIITIIKNSLRVACMLNNIQDDVFLNIKRPKMKEKSVSCFTLTEQKKIEKEVLNSKKTKMFGIILCLYTGLRIGELLALTWEDIDFKKGYLYVNKTCYDYKEDGSYYRKISEPKTESSKRIIPIPKQIIPALINIKQKEKSIYVISSNGKPIRVRSYQKSFELLLKKLSIPHKGFHSLRHTFATRFLECGMDVKTLSEILGHKNANVTLNRYTHALIEHKVDMMNKLGKIFV